MKKIKVSYSKVFDSSYDWVEKEYEEATRCIDACFREDTFYVDGNGVKVPSFSRLFMVIDCIGKIARDKETHAIEQAFFNSGYKYEVVDEPGAEGRQMMEVVSCREVKRVTHVDDICDEFYWDLMRSVTMYALETAMNAKAPAGVAIIMNYLNKEKMVLKSAPEEDDDDGIYDENLADYNATLERAKKMISFEPYRETFFRYYEPEPGEHTYDEYVKTYKPVVDSAFNATTLRVKGSVAYPPFKRYVAMMHRLFTNFAFCTSLGPDEDEDYTTLLDDVNELIAAIIYAIEQALAHNAVACAQMLVYWWETTDVQDCLCRTDIVTVDSMLMHKFHTLVAANKLTGNDIATAFDELYLDEIQGKINYMKKLMRESPEEAMFIIKNTYLLAPETWYVESTSYGQNISCAGWFCPKTSSCARLLSEHVTDVDIFNSDCFKKHVKAGTEGPDGFSNNEFDWELAE